MLAQVRPKDLKLFEDLAASRSKPATPPQAAGDAAARQKAAADGRVDLRVLIPAFMISELRRAIRDRLPDRPAVSRHRHGRRHAGHVDGHDDAAAGGISLPFKILFFVLIDGWNLLDRRPRAVVFLTDRYAPVTNS